MSNFSPDGRQLRSLMSELIGESPGLADNLAGRLSGLSVRYPSPEGAHPLVGRRVPNLRLETGGAVFAALRSAGFLLLDLVGALGTHPSVPTHRVAPLTGRPDWEDVEAVLVRPDGHVAWAGNAAGAPSAVDAAGLMSQPRSPPRPERVVT